MQVKNVVRFNICLSKLESRRNSLLEFIPCDLCVGYRVHLHSLSESEPRCTIRWKKTPVHVNENMETREEQENAMNKLHQIF